MKSVYKPALILAVIFSISVIGLILKNKHAPVIAPQNSAIPASQLPANVYRSTTLGFEIQIPEGWVACTSGAYGGKVKFIKSKKCNGDYTESVIVTSPRHFFEGTPPIYRKIVIDRNENEPFIDWVKQFSQNDRSQLKIPAGSESKFSQIDQNSILEEKPDIKTLSAIRGDTIYIEDNDPKKIAFLVIQDFGSSPIEDFANRLKSISITTGAISGTVSKNTLDRESTTSSVYPYYKGTIYEEDKKTIAATFITDESGNFIVSVPPGTYYFKYPTGLLANYVYLGEVTVNYVPVTE